jgi:hypothetical protein
VIAANQKYVTFGRARSSNFTGLSVSARSKFKRPLSISTDPNILHFCKFPHAQLYFPFCVWPQVKIQVTFYERTEIQIFTGLFSYPEMQLTARLMNAYSFNFTWYLATKCCFAFSAILFPLISTVTISFTQ